MSDTATPNRTTPRDLRLALIISDSAQAQDRADELRSAYGWVEPEDADIYVVVGGDGFMLHVLHEMLDAGISKPCYGINLGTVGFLMNGLHGEVSIADRITRARHVPFRPLSMHATTQSGEKFRYYAINEVSLLRETRQTAKLEIRINGRVRMGELAGDGILLATPVGSTAYNLSANGPILPLGCNMLALTPISPFRPRRWKGAILPESAEVEFRIREPGKRPVAAVADQKEVRDVSTVRISASRERELTLLFDPGFTLEERIFAEQFQV
ncbi:NAD kinase [Novosphingobium sp. 1949]|uniref:NAD kinase n=1 Tax=Novosphingobium organovorum TaxID=2930092 RepID=A0ABT0BBN5_9SPHN|nr:NAD kinase [Novosphingobium organovorum]MCJ2182472.1 NAD kinase [Novosphingobium organovorum]